MGFVARVRTYSSFVKFEHTVFSLPVIFAGALLAGRGWPSARLTALILLAASSGRIVALGLNRIIDRQLDALNPRTQVRELPSRKMTVGEAWAVTLAGGAVYAWAATAIAPICLQLAPIPVVLFVIYPFLKRFTRWAHFGLGLAWCTAPLGGWLAVSQSLAGIGPALWLALFSFLWVAGFDIIYATLDVEVDRQQGWHSLPAKVGPVVALRISALLHALAFLTLAWLYFVYLRSWWALPFLCLASFLLYYEQAKAMDVQLAFFKVNAVLGFVILGFVAAGSI